MLADCQPILASTIKNVERRGERVNYQSDIVEAAFRNTEQENRRVYIIIAVKYGSKNAN